MFSSLLNIAPLHKQKFIAVNIAYTKDFINKKISYNCGTGNSEEFVVEFCLGHSESIDADLVLEEDLVLAHDHNSTSNVEEHAHETD